MNYEYWLTTPKGLRRLVKHRFEPDVTQVIRIVYHGECIDLDPTDLTQVVILAVLDGVTYSDTPRVNRLIHNLLEWKELLKGIFFDELLLCLLNGDFDTVTYVMKGLNLTTCPCEGQNDNCELCEVIEETLIPEVIEDLQLVVHKTRTPLYSLN